MCRYAFHIYKPHFACFHCRKMFRPAAQEDLPLPARPENDNFSDYGRSRVWQKVIRLAKCPQCSQQMHNMGLNFKAPKNNVLKQWRKVELLHRNGFTWHDCGCGGTGPHAKTLRDAEQLIRVRDEQKRAHIIKSKQETQNAKWRTMRKWPLIHSEDKSSTR